MSWQPAVLRKPLEQHPHFRTIHNYQQTSRLRGRVGDKEPSLMPRRLLSCSVHCFSHKGQYSEDWGRHDYATFTACMTECTPSTVPMILAATTSCSASAVTLSVVTADYGGAANVVCAFWGPTSTPGSPYQLFATTTGSVGAADANTVVCPLPVSPNVAETPARVTVQVFHEDSEHPYR